MNILILDSIIRFHIFCRISIGILGLLRKVYIYFTINYWLGVNFHKRCPCSLIVMAFMIGFSFSSSCMKKDAVLAGSVVGSNDNE
jgi:hypothetical protein